MRLNLGCNNFKLPGFLNIDIDQKVNPDKVLDLKLLSQEFQNNSVDFIFAGHLLEHMVYDDSLKLLNDCYNLLKPCCSMLVIVPNYKIAAETLDYKKAERIIMANGDHKQIFDDIKLYDLFAQSNFRHFYNIGLKNVPYMLVSNINDPKADPWQSTILGIKL